jgi:membrane-associated phospholipid phosphatase
MKQGTIFSGRKWFFFNLAALSLLLVCPCNNAKSQENEFPYSMKKRDLYLLPLSLTTNFTAGYLIDKMTYNLSISEIEQLDRNSINVFDRPATYTWNRNLNSVSDVFSEMFPILPAAFFIPQVFHGEWKNVAALGIMYVEIYMFTKGLTRLTKSFSGRIRPYLYNTSFTVEERFGLQGETAPEASTSFISGHTSGIFAAAVFIGKAFTDIYGVSKWSYLVWGTSLSIATFGGYCRVASGEHFPTDVIAGALVGGAIGYLIPVLHKVKMENTNVSVLPGSFHFVYRF